MVGAADVTNLYADVAPDLMRILDNATATSGSIVAEQANLDLLLLNVTGLADTGNALLTDNEQNLTTRPRHSDPRRRPCSTSTRRV